MQMFPQPGSSHLSALSYVIIVQAYISDCNPTNSAATLVWFSELFNILYDSEQSKVLTMVFGFVLSFGYSIKKKWM